MSDCQTLDRLMRHGEEPRLHAGGVVIAPLLDALNLTLKGNKIFVQLRHQPWVSVRFPLLAVRDQLLYVVPAIWT